MFLKEQILKSYIPATLIGLLFVTPFIVSDKLCNGIIVAKEFWFFAVVVAMLLYSGIRLLFVKHSIKIRLNITDILLLAFYAWCFIRAVFTPYTPFWHNHKLQVLTCMMVVYFFVKNTILNERNEVNEDNEKIESKKKQHIFSFIHFFFFSFILSGFLQAVYGLLQLYGVFPSHHNLFKITGSFFNPAPYALYLAVVFPVALGKVLFNERNERIETNERNERNERNEENEKIEKKDISNISSFFHSFIHSLNLPSFISSLNYYLSFATVIAILLVLPVTMIRASWLGALAGSLVVLQYKYHYLQGINHFLKSPFRRIMGAILTIIVVTLIGTGIYLLKKDSANGKLFIWEVTLGKIAEKPLLGHGLGRFEAEYNNWQAAYFQNHPEEMNSKKGWVAGNTKYAFNEFLEMAAEVGITGIIVFVAVIISVFYFIPSCFHSFKNSNFYNVLLFSSLVSLLCCAAFSFPFYSISTLVLEFALIGIITISSNAVLVLKTHSLPLHLSLATMLFAVSIPQFGILQKTPCFSKWNEANHLYAMSDYDAANSRFKDIIPSLAFKGELWQQYGKSLQMDGNNEESFIVLEKAALYTSDYILYTTLGDAYKGIMQYGKAESAYQQASYMEPNKLYPCYLLAKLYDDSGQRLKAVKTAARLLDKNIKVQSTAIEEIRIEMKSIITKYSKR